MISILQNAPENVAAFEATGTITKSDFENTVFPTVKRKVEQFDELNYLLFLNTDINDFTFDAWIQDLLLGIKNLTKWNRCAIVTDHTTIQKFTSIFSVLMPGEFKAFSKLNLQQAISWCENGEEHNN